MISTTIRPHDTIQIRSWLTPLTNLPDKTIGQARLRHTRKTRGTYLFEGMKGFEYYEVTNPIRCTYLERQGPRGGWHVWMTDDPTHWTHMKKLCDALPPGRILCAGLGLGLMVHHLVKRKDITQVHVIELAPDVIKLIQPTLPKDSRIKITNANFYDYIRRHKRRYDAILWDLAVGMAEETRGHFIHAFAQVMSELPGVPLYQFGLRKPGNIFGSNE